MRFYTNEECQQWLDGRGRQKPDRASKKHCLDLKYPPHFYDFAYWSWWIASYLTWRAPALLWITEWGIWPSGENWHLYYTLRHSQGDQRLLEEAPGHVFVGYETAELASFLQVAMLNGWGGYYLTHADFVSAFFGHDEFFEFYPDDEEQLDQIRQGLAGTQKH